MSRSSSTTPQFPSFESESNAEHVFGHFEDKFNPFPYESWDDVDVARIERPSSRIACYDADTLPRRQFSRMRPVKVRLYPCVLDGQQGLYTIAQISRHANISPTRGTAMFLRRFRLITEFLDRRHAVGYDGISTYPLSSSTSESKSAAPRHQRWKGHGASKLRNEIRLEAFVEDDYSDEDLSFNVAAECTRALDLLDDSMDFEAALTPPWDCSDESFRGDVYDFIATKPLQELQKS